MATLVREAEALTATRRLTILDLDGTITFSDTLIPFLSGCLVRHPRLTMGLVLLPFDILRFALGWLTAKTLKERLLTASLGGMAVESIEGWAREFASRTIRSGCRPSILAFIRECQATGDRLIILSASPSIYVRFIAEGLGITELVSSGAEIRDGRYTGKLIGENCAGREKLRRLIQYLGTHKYHGTTLALGNAKSDLPVLEWADEAWLVKGDERIPVRSTLGYPESALTWSASHRRSSG